MWGGRRAPASRPAPGFTGSASRGLAGDGEGAPAVPLPAVFGGLPAQRDLLAVGHRFEPRRRHAELNQVVEGSLGAPLAEREVVLDRASLVGVSFYGDLQEVE